MTCMAMRTLLPQRRALLLHDNMEVEGVRSTLMKYLGPFLAAVNSGVAGQVKLILSSCFSALPLPPHPSLKAAMDLFIIRAIRYLGIGDGLDLPPTRQRKKANS